MVYEPCVLVDWYGDCVYIVYRTVIVRTSCQSRQDQWLYKPCCVYVEMIRYIIGLKLSRTNQCFNSNDTTWPIWKCTALYIYIFVLIILYTISHICPRSDTNLKCWGFHTPTDKRLFTGSHFVVEKLLRVTIYINELYYTLYLLHFIDFYLYQTDVKWNDAVWYWCFRFYKDTIRSHLKPLHDIRLH